MARARRGFTLIELVVVLAVISFVAGMAIPRYSSAAARYRVKAAARRVAMDVEHARNLSRGRSEKVRLEFKLAENGFYQARAVGGSETLYYTVHLWQEPYGAEVREADFDGSPTLLFDGYGRSTGGQVVVGVGGWEARVHVDGPSGVVTVTDP